MRGLLLDLSRRRWSRRDLLALVVVVLYTLVAISAHTGAQVAGQGLDPVWAGVQQRGVLRVAVDFGFYPFADIAEGEPAGYDIDLSRAIAHKLGVAVEFVPSGLDSIYDDLAAGKADMAASALPYAPEQGWRVTFSEFYFNAGQVLVVPSGSPVYSAGDLPNRRLGVPLGSDADTYARRLVHDLPAIDLRTEYDTPAEVLDDLRSGHLDAAIVDNAAALGYVGRYSDLRLVEALTLEPYALAMPARAYRLREQVNRALEELRHEGFFEELGRKWFVEARPTRP